MGYWQLLVEGFRASVFRITEGKVQGSLCAGSCLAGQRVLGIRVIIGAGV